MSTTKTQLFDPPTQYSDLEESIQKYLLTLSALMPLYEVDTTAGSYSEAPPPAGLNNATGQSNQSMEITYIKTSADGNVFTLTGVEGGPYTLTAQFQTLKIKSNATFWYKTA